MPFNRRDKMKKLLSIAAILALPGLLNAQENTGSESLEDVLNDSEIVVQDQKDIPEKSWHDDHKLTLGARVQTLFIIAGSDDLGNVPNPQKNLVDVDPDKDTSELDGRIRRLRLQAKGQIADNFEYKLDFRAESHVNMNKGGTSPNGGITESWVGYKNTDAFRVRLGTMVFPFSREWQTSSANMTTIERALVSNVMANPFDSGLAFDGRLLDKKLSYQFGVYDGSGGTFDGANVDGTRSPLTAARIQIDPLGEYNNGQAIFSKKTLLSIGIAGFFQKSSAPGANPYNTGGLENVGAGTIDIGIQSGDLNVEGGYFYSTSDSYDMSGYYAQIAYMIIPYAWQLWGKYEVLVDESLENYDYAGTTTVTESEDLSKTDYASWGITYYPGYRHHLKFQAAYMMGLNNKGFSQKDRQFKKLSYHDDWFGFMAHLTF